MLRTVTITFLQQVFLSLAFPGGTQGLSSGAAAGVSVVVTVVVVVLAGGVVIAVVALWLVRRRPTKPDTGEDIVFQQKVEESHDNHDNENEGEEEGANL